jgi:hypothetical protein
MQPRAVQLVNHEAHDSVVMFSDHPDAVALAQAPDEVILAPGELESFSLDIEHFRHIAANHPTDVNPQLLALLRIHLGLLPGTSRV